MEIPFARPAAILPSKKREGKFPKLLCQTPIKEGDLIWVRQGKEDIRAKIVDISDNEKGGTEVFWREIEHERKRQIN